MGSKVCTTCSKVCIWRKHGETLWGTLFHLDAHFLCLWSRCFCHWFLDLLDIVLQLCRDLPFALWFGTLERKNNIVRLVKIADGIKSLHNMFKSLHLEKTWGNFVGNTSSLGYSLLVCGHHPTLSSFLQ